MPSYLFDSNLHLSLKGHGIRIWMCILMANFARELKHCSMNRLETIVQSSASELSTLRLRLCLLTLSSVTPCPWGVECRDSGPARGNLAAWPSVWTRSPVTLVTPAQAELRLRLNWDCEMEREQKYKSRVLSRSDYNQYSPHFWKYWRARARSGANICLSRLCLGLCWQSLINIAIWRFWEIKEMEQGIKLNIENTLSFCLSSLVLKFSEASRFSCGVRIKLPLIVAVDGGDEGPHAGDWDWDLRRERREGTSSGDWCLVFTLRRAPAWCWPWPTSRAQSQDTHSHTVTQSHHCFVNWKIKFNHDDPAP